MKRSRVGGSERHTPHAEHASSEDHGCRQQANAQALGGHHDGALFEGWVARIAPRYRQIQVLG